MANLRILQINAADSRTVKARFSDDLYLGLTTQNVVVEGIDPGIPDAEVRRVQVRDNILNIEVLPLTPYAQYKVIFQSSPGVRFRNKTENAFLIEDGISNAIKMLGAENPTNDIRDGLVANLKDNIYNLGRGTLVRTILNQLSTEMLRFRHDVGQAKNDNYLNVTVTDERKIRGFGPWDRLNEEGTFDVTRVATTPTNITLPGSISFIDFPSTVITLQRVVVNQEELVAGTGPGTFDALTLTLNNSPVTKLTSVVIQYQGGGTFEYNIRSLGYQLKEPKYDEGFASTLLTLEDNQAKLSDVILEDPSLVIPGGGDKIVVSYEYKSLGRVIDTDSVTVTQVLDATRETVPALAKEFTLKKSPVVTASDEVATRNGVIWRDPQSITPFLTTHPAFLREIPFRYSGLPSRPGEYSVDYATGRVFVYGAETNDGTGSFPPTATYKYRNTFVSTLDYTYDPEQRDLVASPLRELAGQQAKISYLYEQTLTPGVDYKSDIHLETINERVENRVLSSNSLRPLHFPVTNAFRIFNETTGEVYGLSRFTDDTIYFTSTQPPRVIPATLERAEFHDKLNETLIVESEFTNVGGVRIFKIRLQNQNIMSATEDVIGNSYNTSVLFSRGDIFEQELFFDGQILSEVQNTNRLSIGQYQVDYRNGFAYVGVAADQVFNVGTVSYKRPVISPKNPHVIAVSNIYHSINPNAGVSKQLDYISFGEDEIVPRTFDVSDERFLNGDTTLPYQVSSTGTITVTDDIDTVRHIYDAFDLNNNDVPTDFGETATWEANIITLEPDGVPKSAAPLTVAAGLTVTVPTISPGIELSTVKSVIRLSDGYELLDGYQTLSGNTITLGATSGAIVGDQVEVLYTVALTVAATPIVDYDRGEYFIDYTYIADEILVTYEYGDNVIDFRESSALEVGEEYFVSYRAGALRGALLENFGSLIDIPEVRSFDVDLPRERYRDALIGALQSYTQGPTLPAFKTIVSSVTKIKPQIVEAAFEIWSLGISWLYSLIFGVQGEPQLVAGKWDQGILCDKAGESVSFPISSNLRLEEGSFECWVIPEWNGLDNDATLTFSSLRKDGYVLPTSSIYIGASSYHPEIQDGSFTLNRRDRADPTGLPAAIFTQTGLFIYFDTDENRWKVLAKDNPQDGYDGYVYSGSIASSGEVYDVKNIPGLGEVDDLLRSTTSAIDFEFRLNFRDKASPDGYTTGDGYISGYSFDGIQFMADDRHYIFDFGETENKNRFSLYKDGRGYLVFEVWDRGNGDYQKQDRRNVYQVSADIQGWEAGEKHHVAMSWELNSGDRRDEMHLFIDGFEVPNIMHYGGIPPAVSTDRFRTVKPELVAGTLPKNAVVGDDLSTTAGSNLVTSASIDFAAQGIVPGDTIHIREEGFSTYTINGVAANTLQLTLTMPKTTVGSRFSVNEYSIVVSSQIDLYTNIIVSTLLSGVETELPGLRADIPAYAISKNSQNQNVLTILGDALAGSQILVRTLGLNHRRCRDRMYLWDGYQAVLKTQMPPPINLDEASIRSVILPYVVAGPGNSVISGGKFLYSPPPATQPSSTEGRLLDVRVTGGNVDFSTPTTVTINGTSTGGTSETLSFSTFGTQTTVNKWQTITSIDIDTKPITTSRDGIGVEIMETYSMTIANGNTNYPFIRFAYQTQSGLSLEGDGSDVVSDPLGFFALSDVDNVLVIEEPASVVGTYKIIEKIDNTTVRLEIPTGTAFSGGRYRVYNVSIGRSGFQNGFFYMQSAAAPTQPYPLPRGWYEFDYAAYLEIPFDPVNQTAYIGNDMTGTKPAKAVIDELRIRNLQITDTRVGESIAANEESVTTSYQALRPFTKDQSTLVLLHFEELPPTNDVNYYQFAQREYIQSGTSVNERFGQSIVIRDKGLTFDNKGRLTTRSEGTIEFMVSPRYDTYNDPVRRYYFDAAAATIEETISITKGNVRVSGRIGEVLSVRLQTDTENTGTDFAAGGTVADDFQTINLKQALPYQRTPVKVAYIPSGSKGDRISIYKEETGYIVFNVRAGGADYQTRQPVFWSRDTWHRIRATYKFNRHDNLDEIRLFVDGEERGVVRFGMGLLYGQGFVFGQSMAGVTDQILITDINFTDTIPQFMIGMNYDGTGGAQARIDNFKLSDISLGPITIGGQPFDVNYSTNLDIVYPVVEDAFTTFLLDFDRTVTKNEDFAILRDAQFGIFNFDLNIIDSFDIVLDSARVQQLLEAMLFALKPANSKMTITYVR